MKHLLTADESARVAERVAAAERSTAGEIVVVVAERSSDYAAERTAFSFSLTLLLAIATYFLVPRIPEVWVLTGQAPAMVLLWWFSGRPVILRRLVSSVDQMGKVEARAKQLFVEHGVTETRQRSGVLLYLSQAERRVQLLADRGIHERVGQEVWQRTVDAVVAAIHEGKAARGIIEAVDAIGASLAQHFPAQAGDVNELSDAPRPG